MGMGSAPALSPELTRQSIALARALSAAARSWALYPLRDQTKAGDKPDPDTARKIVDSLASIETQDRTSLLALTALKKHDNYTVTHIVNVAALAMAQACALNLDGPLLREFAFAALMHDVGKVNTPQEVRFVNLMGMSPVGTIVRLNTDEAGVVTAERPEDPFRPQVKILFNARGERLEEPCLAHTWERDARGEFPRAVVESVDPDSMDLDPLSPL